jgi:hypothetical protein
MSHTDVLILAVAIGAVGGLLGGGLALLFGLKLRRRLFAGPQRQAWDLARADLGRADQWHVQRATSRRRPVSRGYLAPAQLVYTRYVDYTAQQSPLRRRRIRLAATGFFTAIGAANIIPAALSTPVHVVNVLSGSYILLMAGLYGLWLPRWLRQTPQRMLNLRRQIRAAHPDDWA